MTTLRTTLTISAALTACLAAAPSSALAQDAGPSAAPSVEPSAAPAGVTPPAAPPPASSGGHRAPPTPGLGWAGAPPAYWAPSGAILPKPVPFEDHTPPMRRNPALAGAGGATMGAGLLTFFVGLGVQISNTQCETVLYVFPSCRQKDAGVDTAAKGTMIAGGLLFFTGLPILIVGLRKRPVSEEAASLVGHPTPNGWGWRF